MAPVCSNCGANDFVWANELKTGMIGRGTLSLRSQGELSLGTRICRACGHADLFLKDPAILRQPHTWRPGEFVPIPAAPSSSAHHGAPHAVAPPPAPAASATEPSPTAPAPVAPMISPSPAAPMIPPPPPPLPADEPAGPLAEATPAPAPASEAAGPMEASPGVGNGTAPRTPRRRSKSKPKGASGGAGSRSS